MDFVDRLAGAALVGPDINYWWRNLPRDITKDAFSLTSPADQWALRIAHHAPWLTYWWNTQKWFPFSNVIAGNPVIFSRQDTEASDQIWYNKQHIYMFTCTISLV
ncbi:alpha/beta-Hydrolases superfamily protein [Raphanus sativus]|nr:alpha/beta-Hydrolases superfamily protein [Raphanus sativus]